LIKAPDTGISFSFDPGSINSSFFASLVWVYFAYSGWNASTYIAGRLKNPKKALRRSLLWGTTFVVVCYVFLHFVFLKFAPIKELAGQIDVVHVVSRNMFGVEISRYVSLLMAVTLLSSLSALFISGSRVLQIMGEDLVLLRPFAKETKSGAPYLAILFEGFISLFFVLTISFESIITYMGMTLSLFTTLTVAGLFILRTKRKVIPIKTPFFPIPPLIFISFNLAMAFFLTYFNPFILGFSLLSITGGILIYFWLKYLK
jgi:APA family basic amino acid/polyamine antiporter